MKYIELPCDANLKRNVEKTVSQNFCCVSFFICNRSEMQLTIPGISISGEASLQLSKHFFVGYEVWTFSLLMPYLTGWLLQLQLSASTHASSAV